MVIIMSVMFLFYGLIFMTGAIEAYDGPFSMIFGAIFVSGGFLFNFGQFVPSWDSSYYNLMMSQNIKYRDYLSSKWWLMVIVTIVATVLASFYLFFGWKVYLAVIAVAFYNVGINAYIVLLAGAFTRTPIDLTSNKNAFGDKKAFNFKTFLLIIPQIILPVALYFVGNYFFSDLVGFAFVAGAGIAGFALKGKVFNMIENIYQKQKYETIAAYKQKN
jgi:multisubunit Na+/H+ antiporter MnhC subunit